MDGLLKHWPNLERYRADNEALPLPPDGQKRVVFLGDSITDQWDDPALPEWTEEAIEETVRGLAAEKEKGARHLIHPLRFATTGRTVSAGLFETMQLLGRERCLLRIEDVLEKMHQLSTSVG